MFLADFNTTEQDAFYTLAVYLMNADGAVSEVESALLSQYLWEMSYSASPELLTVDDAISVFCDSSKKIRKQSFIELVSLAKCDEISIEENDYLKNIAERFGFTNHEVYELTKCVDDLTSLYAEINEIVSK